MKHLKELIEGLPVEVEALNRFMEDNPELDCEDIKNLVIFLTDFGDALSPEFRELTVAAEELCDFEDMEYEPEKSKHELMERRERFYRAVAAVWSIAVRNYAKKREDFWEKNPDHFGEE